MNLLKNDNSALCFVLKQFSASFDNQNTQILPNFSDTRQTKMPSKDPLALVWLFTHLARLSGFSQTGYWDKNYSRVDFVYAYKQSAN